MQLQARAPTIHPISHTIYHTSAGQVQVYRSAIRKPRQEGRGGRACVACCDWPMEWAGSNARVQSGPWQSAARYTSDVCMHVCMHAIRP